MALGLGPQALPSPTVTSLDEQTSAWVEICIRLAPSAHEGMGAFLFDLGCDGLVADEGDSEILKAYFPIPQDLEGLKEKVFGFLGELAKIFPEVRSPRVTLKKIRKKDWAKNWRRFFRPVRATPGLLILPAWESLPEDAPGEVILVDPGPAFGTGRHATTRMCLLAMEQTRRADPWSMLDVGTGSGILAIYAARLGAARIVALDNDPEALRWAERNIALNGLTGRIELANAEPHALKETFSLIVANLTLATILELLPAFPPLLDPGGWMILSGLLRGQVKEVRGDLRRQGFLIEQVLRGQEWACVIAKNDPEKAEP